MKVPGVLEGQPATIEYNTNGFEFYRIVVHIAYTTFQWDELSPMQQVSILQQLENAFPRAEQNYN